MSRRLLIDAITIALILATRVATAQVTDVRWDQVENTLEGFVTNDLLIDFDGWYTGTEMLLELESGSIFQHSAGGKTPPVAALFSVFDGLEFDTFVALGSSVSGGPFGEPNPGVGAFKVGGNVTPQFDSERIDQNWYDNSLDASPILDQSDFLTARVTLSDDASGAWIARMYPVATAVTVSGSIAEGHILVDLPGDYDSTAFVGQGDLNLLLLNWGKPAIPTPNGWLRNPPSGLISQNELDAVLLNWGRRNPFSSAVAGAAATTPEPCTLGLMAVATAALLVLRFKYNG